MGAMSPTLDLPNQINDALEDVIRIFDAETRSDLSFLNALVARVRHYRGKLLRPRLVLMAGVASGELVRDHMVLAAVVEMVHMATLVHDDVLDESAVRRRSDTINNLIGNEGAVLLGDYLISHAYHLCSSLASTEASHRIAATTNTVCEGELMQIENRGNFDLTEGQYLEIISRKTAALTGICCELGAGCSGAEPDVVEHLSRYGLELGMAFQIVDDLLDLTGTQVEMGKSVGRDAEMGKMTLPLIKFVEQASTSRREELVAVLRGDGAQKNARVRRVIAGSDCIERAEEIAQAYVRSAISHLGALPDGEAKASLIAAADFVVQRRT